MRFSSSIKNTFSPSTAIAGLLCLVSIAVLLPTKSSAQNQPIYNQFFLNPFIYNPAYAGKNPNSMGYLNFRQQWIGIDGAPTSYTFMFDTELKKGVSFGILAQNDSRGIVSTSSAQFTLGYGVKFDDNQGLRFGLSAGAGTNSLDIDNNITDQAILNAQNNNFFLLGRVGLNYYYKDINLSFSVPDIFKRKLLGADAISPIEIDPLDQYIVMASAKINLVPQDKTLSFSPYFLYRGSGDGTSYFEAVGKFDIKDIVWVGASYRQNYGIVGLGGIKLKNILTIGYGYEIPTADIAGISNATHEVQVSILLGKDKIKEAEEKKARLEAKREKQRIAREQAAQKRKEEAKAKAEQERQEQEARDKAEQEAQEREKEEARKEAEAQLERERQLAHEQENSDAVNDGAAQPDGQAQEVIEREDNVQTIEEDPVEITQPTEIENSQESQIEETTETITPTETIAETVNEETAQADDKTEEVKEEQPVVLQKGNASDELAEDHYVVVGSFNEKQHADKYVKQLRQQGYDAGHGYSTQKGRYYVHLYKSSSAGDTRRERDKYRKISQFKDAWHLEVRANDIKELGNNSTPQSTFPDNRTTSDSPKLTVKKGNHILELNLGHYVVVGAFSSFSNAERYSDQVHSMGHENSFGYSSEKQLYYVFIHQGDGAEDTRSQRDKFRKMKAFKDAWYLLVEE